MSSDDKRNRKFSVTARELAMDVLTRIEQEGAFSNLLLKDALNNAKLDARDTGLVTELVYGTIQYRMTIDYWLRPLLKKGIDHLEPWVKSLLRMSFYQLQYLERIPPHAIVNEAVNIAKRRGHKGIVAMVNGVLRNALRQQNEWVIPDSLSAIEQISLRHSHPRWLVKRWIAQYGEADTEAICAANNERPKSSIRVNRLAIERDALLAQYAETGIEAEASALSPDGIVIRQGGSLSTMDGFVEGMYSIQDESSMLVAESVDPSAGMRVLDCCAAPGGKTMHMAERMNNEGSVVANDIHAHKEQLLRQQAERLNIQIVETIVGDAAALSERYAESSFDRVLLDAPCSGLGVIRRKPDMKWSKKPEDIAAIAVIQAALLDAVCMLVKPGGMLVYSTCTIEQAENIEQIEAFLNRNEQFELEPFPDAMCLEARLGKQARRGWVQILPHQWGTDGFFIARLRRKH